MRLLFITDVHGHRTAIEQALHVAASRRVNAVVFGGDLTPKKLAVQLRPKQDLEHLEQTFEEHEEEVPCGDVVPLDQIGPGGPGQKTFRASLEKVRDLNESLGSPTYANWLREHGYVVAQEENAFFEIESMLLEHSMLEKLACCANEHSRTERRRNVQLTEEERELSLDCLPDWFREWEAQLTEHTRASYLARYNARFQTKGQHFEEIAPSKSIREYLLTTFAGKDLEATVRELSKLRLDGKHPLASHINSQLSMLTERVVRSSQLMSVLDVEHFHNLVRYTSAAEFERRWSGLHHFTTGQAAFIKDYFVPLIRDWRAHHGIPVFAMLANDDMIENEALLNEAEADGVLKNTNGSVHELEPGLVLAGYGFVESLPPDILYQAWKKDGEEVLVDLQRLQSRCVGTRSVWTIHNPPLDVLDECDDGHVGSKAVLDFINLEQPPIALFGHIHEARRFAGTHQAHIGKTLCVNPGAEHDDGANISVIDTESNTAEWVKGGEESDGATSRAAPGS